MKKEFYISADKSKLDLEVIVGFLKYKSYWAKGRSAEIVVKSIQNSLCFGVYSPDHQQAGFARVVSDYAVYAYIMDLFIVEEYRKKGLSKLLMAEIMNHPDLQGLQRWGLGTHDAHKLYEKFGFRPLANPEIFMEKTAQPL